MNVRPATVSFEDLTSLFCWVSMYRSTNSKSNLIGDGYLLGWTISMLREMDGQTLTVYFIVKVTMIGSSFSWCLINFRFFMTNSSHEGYKMICSDRQMRSLCVLFYVVWKMIWRIATWDDSYSYNVPVIIWSCTSFEGSSRGKKLRHDNQSIVAAGDRLAPVATF